MTEEPSPISYQAFDYLRTVLKQTSHPNAGQQFGKFLLVRELGAGAMGTVFLAHQDDLNREVAVKLLKSPGNDLARSYFSREAQLAAGLDHPNIAKVFEVGEHDGNPYISMQFIDGMTLSVAKKEMKLEEKARVARCIAEALTYAHGKNVIHRDLKPANVMIDRQQRVYVMDFGLARRTAVDGESLAGTNMVMGTPGYMAPEQARGRSDPQSDVYGVGAILYELVTGRPPFVGDSPTEIMLQVVNDEPVMPRKLRPGLPEDLEAVILHCLEKDQERRYASTALLSEDLDAYLQGNPLCHARRPTVGYLLAKRVRKQPLLWGLGGGLTAAVLLGGSLTTALLVRTVRESKKAAREASMRLDAELEAREADQRLAFQREQATRKELGLKKLAIFWFSIVEWKQELRRGRVPPDVARQALSRIDAELVQFIADCDFQSQGYYLRARCALYRGRLKDAESFVVKALNIAPEFTAAQVLFGIVKVQQGVEQSIGTDQTLKRARAAAWPLIDEGIRALTVTPRDAGRQEQAEKWGLPWTREDHVAVQMAEVLQVGHVQRDLQKTVESLEAAWSECRAEEFADLLGEVVSNPDDKIRWYTRAIEVAPGYEWPYFSRGLCRFRRQDFQGAIEDMNRGIAIRNDLAFAYCNRAIVKNASGDRQGAIEDCGRALAIDDQYVRAYRIRGLYRLDTGELEMAMADFTCALKIDPTHADVYVNRGLVRQKRGDRDGAIEDYTKAVELAPQDARNYSLRGFARASKGDLDGAIADHTKAIELAPQDAGNYSSRGNAQKAKGDLADCYCSRGQARESKGDLDGAIADYTKAIELAPQDARNYSLRGFARVQKGDLDGAIADWTKAIELAPQDADYYSSRGSARKLKGDLDGAIVDYDRAISLENDDWPSFWGRAQAKVQKGEGKSALSDYDQAIRLKPDSALLYFDRGRLKSDLGDQEGAIRDYDKAIQLDGSDADYYCNRGCAKEHMGDLENAIADYTRAIEIKGDEPDYFYNRANARHTTKDLLGALADYDQAIKLRPDFPEALANRGKVKADNGDRSGALADYRRALEIAPKGWDGREKVDEAIKEVPK